MQFRRSRQVAQCCILHDKAGQSMLLHPQVDVTTGRRVRVDLDVPYPPFYFHWSPCGTRLAMLSNWHHMQCVIEGPL